ncbi:hypothetical protein GCM10011412_28240 [Maribacter cobaltidurans]|nr:hypothetical protein GCM10011412_28240 [Maribacter cobaltidurans]
MGHVSQNSSRLGKVCRKSAILKNCSFENEFENKKNPTLYPIFFLTEKSVQIPKFTGRMSYPLFKEPCEMLWIFKP